MTAALSVVNDALRRMGASAVALLLVCACATDGQGRSPVDTSDVGTAPEETDAGEDPTSDTAGTSPPATIVEGAFAYALGDRDEGDILAINFDTQAIGVITRVEEPQRIWVANGEPWVATFDALYHLDTTGAELGVFELEGVSHLFSDEDSVWVQGGPVSAPPRSEPYFSKLDPTGHDLVSSVPPPDSLFLDSSAVGGGSLWVTWTGLGPPREIERRDPDTLAILDTISLEIEIRSLAWGEDSLWVAGQVDARGEEIVVLRISADGGVEAEIPIPDFQGVGGITGAQGGAGLVVGLGGIWLSNEFGFEVVRIDPTTDSEVARIPVAPNPSSPTTGVSIGAGRIWLRDAETMYAIDPTTNEATPRIELPTRGVFSLVRNIAFVTDGQ